MVLISLTLMVSVMVLDPGKDIGLFGAVSLTLVVVGVNMAFFFAMIMRPIILHATSVDEENADFLSKMVQRLGKVHRLAACLEYLFHLPPGSFRRQHRQQEQQQHIEIPSVDQNPMHDVHEWERFLDDETQDYYWVNSKTGVSQWEPPESLDPLVDGGLELEELEINAMLEKEKLTERANEAQQGKEFETKLRKKKVKKVKKAKKKKGVIV